jgi:glycerol-3-phosphate dehydrogenase
VYGTDAGQIQNLIEANPQLGERLHPALPYLKAQVMWAAQQEMARTVEDVLARRTRALFLNARAAMEMAPAVAEMMGGVLGWNGTAKADQITAFEQSARNYLGPRT